MTKNQLDVFTNPFSYNTFINRYSLDKQESWEDLSHRVVNNVCGQYLDSDTKEEIYNIIYNRYFIPGGRYLASAGRGFHQVNNCFTFRAEDTREDWSELMQKITVSLMSGGGIGVDYSRLRSKNTPIRRTGGVSSGPIALMHMINEAGRYIRMGGERRSAIWAGLNWNHPDIKDFLELKNHSELYKIAKDQDNTFSLPMEGTNISVIYDTDFFVAIENKKHENHQKAKDIWNKNCLQAFSTAEPGFSFNFLKDNESLRNACCEVTSEDDSDKCNLGTVWINRIPDRDVFAKTIKYSTLFLLCGGLYSDVPTTKIREIGQKNNRIGLGLGGIHEWLMSRKMDYEVTSELHKWLRIYEQESDSAAYLGAKELGVSIPKGKRAIAPTGTIGIIAESTTGIEPLFCKSYKRRYYKNENWQYEYVIDGSVKRLMDKGIKIEEIKDSGDILFKDRVKFQADVQNYVDMSISSTCNMTAWGSETNNESTLEGYSKTLLKYAKRLRGFTCYPDGCRSGQPLERVDLKLAMEQEGKVFEEKETQCVGGVCGV